MTGDLAAMDKPVDNQWVTTEKAVYAAFRCS